MSRTKQSAEKSREKTLWRVALAGLMSSTALSGVAAAQEENEIIVTATKRAESIQDIPLSIQALGATTLEEHGVSSFDDYAQLLPSVSYQSFGPGQAQVFFRGVSSGGDGLHIGSSPTSSTYLDDTPVTTIANTIDIQMYDINRVEALSGPQGTLFGASSLSGVLRIITNQPDPSGFAAGYEAEANVFTDGGAGGSFQGFVNLPVRSNIALRAVGWYDRDGGYIDNTPASRTFTLGDGDPSTNLTVDNSDLVGEDINEVETYGGRAAMRIDLNNHWTSTTTVLGQRQQVDGPFLFDPRVGDLEVHDFLPTSNKDEWAMISETIEGRIANFDMVYSASYFDRRVESAVDYSYYSVAYDSFDGSNYTYFPDGSGGYLDPTQNANFTDDYTKETHELRVNSPAELPVRVTAGLFYQRQTDYDQADYFIPGLASVPADPQSALSVIPGLGDDVFARRLEREDVDKAMFGEVSVDILPTLTLTGGVRFFQAENSLTGFSGFASAAADPLTCLPTSSSDRPCDNVFKSFEEDGETYKLSLSLDVTDDIMLYGTYANGYRPGGANRRAEIPPYTSDTIDNWEVGWKSTLFDNTLRFNGAVFYQIWSDLQFGLAPPDYQGVTFIFNAGGADITGIETDFSWVLGDLTLSGSASYINAELTEDFCNYDSSGLPTDCAPYGTQLPVQPPFKGTLTARYDFTVGSWDAWFQGTVLNQSGTRTFLLDSDYANVGRTEAFTTLDLSTGLEFDNSTLEFFVNNVTDERGILSRNTSCATYLCGPVARSYPTQPQLMGVRFSQDF
ncbi:MAG: TonB-dependent receptor [Hyphomonadaceae bacterium]|nr:TonB-dependent receptor [Hyphomonadaceae bacterium]